METASVFEWKPGFSLTKYGSVFTLNCNQEFAQRFKNVLRDCGGDEPTITALAEDFKYCLESNEETIDPDSNGFMLSKFGHVYLLTCKRELMHRLNSALQNFLVTNRVSPAIFSFSQQLDGYLLNKFAQKANCNY
jgi:hypothetical protein